MFPYNRRMRDYLVATERAGIASLADDMQEDLRADEGAEYDQLIEINLSELEPHINGPFTPDLAHPLSEFADAVKANGWPEELTAGLRAAEEDEVRGERAFGVDEGAMLRAAHAAAVH